MVLLLCFELKAQLLLKKGESAPDFDAIEIISKKEKKLSSVNANFCLIVFCERCQASLPQIKKIYYEYHLKGLEIYAVCLCDNCDSQITLLTENQIEWITVRPWGEAYSKDGNIDKFIGTYSDHYVNLSIPNFYLLDKNKVALTGRLTSFIKLELELKRQIK